MDISSAFAVQGYASTRPATAPSSEVTSESFEAKAAEKIGSFTESLKQNENVAQTAMTGGADSQALVQALAQTELAIEAAVAVRDKVVEAYQEILRMPV
jgi:flagellar hook-basal body complex protein FliE